jgi:hypothetical protein
MAGRRRTGEARGERGRGEKRKAREASEITGKAEIYLLTPLSEQAVEKRAVTPANAGVQKKRRPIINRMLDAGVRVCVRTLACEWFNGA